MITLRLATLSDIPSIREVAELTWPVSYSTIISPEQIRYMLDLMYDEQKIGTSIMDPKQDFWLAEENGSVLGFCGIEVDFPEQGTTRIHKLYVLPQTQGTGLGKMLVDQVELEARNRNQSKLHLNVNKQNKAVEFYRKNGFAVHHEEVLDIGNGFVMDDFVMVKEWD